MNDVTDPRQPTRRSGDRKGQCCYALHKYKDFLLVQEAAVKAVGKCNLLTSYTNCHRHIVSVKLNFPFNKETKFRYNYAIMLTGNQF